MVVYVECLPADRPWWCLRHAGALAWRRGPVCAYTRVCWCRRIFTYIYILRYQWRQRSISIRHRWPSDQRQGVNHKGCEEKHSHTVAHHPVVKPPAKLSTAVSHTPTQQQGWYAHIHTGNLSPLGLAPDARYRSR